MVKIFKLLCAAIVASSFAMAQDDIDSYAIDLNTDIYNELAVD